MDLPTRKNIRLQGYNYSQNGAYFITICVKDRHQILWDAAEANCAGENTRIIDIDGLNDGGRPQVDHKTTCDPPQLSPIGKIIDYEINKIPAIYENVKIDKYVIMPNHIHLIIFIDGFVKTDECRTSPAVGANCVRPPSAVVRPPCSSAQEPPTISRIIKQFKGSISKQIGYSIWQKLFHDHIIRNDEEYNKIWQYIDENPIRWQDDCYYE